MFFIFAHADCEDERRGQTMTRAINADLLFFHRFQQRTLRFGAGTIEFIRQKNLAKHRAGMKPKLPAVRLKHRRTDHIGWQ